MVPSKIMIVQIWGTSILNITIDGMVTTLDSSLDLSLFDDVH